MNSDKYLKQMMQRNVLDQIQEIILLIDRLQTEISDLREKVDKVGEHADTESYKQY